ncbi:MAG TPA: SIS domain-containing protein [Terracidiphilus sp.]
MEVIQGRYFADLLDQPQALNSTWNALRASTVFEKIALNCEQSRFERVVLTGMGGSCFGLHPLSIELAAQGWTALTIETSELIHYYPHLLAPSTLIVAVSQSGKSAETLRMLDLNQHRATMIGVTNWPDSPLAQQANFAVLTAAGEEYSVSCKTYVCAQMAFRVLGAVLTGKDATETLHVLEPAPRLFQHYLANWKDHVEELAKLLQGVSDIFLVGRGPSLAAAQTGALTLKESTHFHAEGMSSAALRHGPLDMLKEGIFVGVFAGDTQTRSLNESLVRDVAATGARVALISEDASLTSFRIPVQSETLRPLLEMLPVQMMTLTLAALANREAGKFVRATKVTTVE